MTPEDAKLMKLCEQGIHSWNTVGTVRETHVTKRFQQCDRCKVVRLVV
jgi:hypothetical protein